MVTVEDIQKLDPDRFELLVARLLEESGLSNVLPIGGTGDEGIDLRAEWFLELPTGDTQTSYWAVQCKRYSSPISPQQIHDILNAALEPPTDIFPIPPDFFLIAISSRLTTSARRIIERANRNRGKYSCRFLVWDGEAIAAKVSESPRITEQFFGTRVPLSASPTKIPVARLTVLLDKVGDEAALTFLYESCGTQPVTLMAKTTMEGDDFESIAKQCQQLASEMVVPRYTEDNEQFLKRTGKAIYELIPDSIKTALLTQGDVYIRLASNIHLIPFEIAYDEHIGAFLGERTKVGRIQVSAAISAQQVPWPQPSILLIGNVRPVADQRFSFPYLSYAEKELEGLAHTLASQGFEINTLSGEDATRERLHRLLQGEGFQMIHFSGHGLAEPDGRGGILLADGIVSYEDITSYPVSGSLIFLSACSSGRVLNDISKQFIRAGANALIGFVGPVTDEAASILALVFYSEVAQGQTLGTAIQKARLYQRASLPNDLSWASFVLFGDPTVTIAIQRS
jgi:CHAT domain-containing protein